MNSFLGTALTEHIAYTPEHYLVCRSVPIARSGWQEYKGREIGPELDADRTYRVWRDSAQVFSPAAAASAEGKAVTRTHPPVMLNADNTSSFARGHAQHVRRDGDLLVADLVVTCPVLAQEILAGRLREVSCGYTCRYYPLGENEFSQEGIQINHIAIVEDARAGGRVAIQDAANGGPMTTKTMKELIEEIKKIRDSVTLGDELDEIRHGADEVERLTASGCGPGTFAGALRKSNEAYRKYDDAEKTGKTFAEEAKKMGQAMQDRFRKAACTKDSALREHSVPQESEDFFAAARRIGNRMRGGR